MIDITELTTEVSEIDRRQREAEARVRRKAARDACQAPADAAATPPTSTLSQKEACPIEYGAGSEEEPSYELTEEVAEAGMVVGLILRLPRLESLQGVDVEISDAALHVCAPGVYRLQLQWPTPVSSLDAKAKFVKKSRTLRLRIPQKK